MNEKKGHRERVHWPLWVALALLTFFVFGNVYGNWQQYPRSSYLIIYPLFRFAQSTLEELTLLAVITGLFVYWGTQYGWRVRVAQFAILFLPLSISCLLVSMQSLNVTFERQESLVLDGQRYRLLEMHRGGFEYVNYMLTLLRCDGIFCRQIYTAGAGDPWDGTQPYQSTLTYDSTTDQLQVLHDEQIMHVIDSVTRGQMLPQRLPETLPTIAPGTTRDVTSFLTLPRGAVGEVAFSPDGTTLAMGASVRGGNDYAEGRGVHLLQLQGNMRLRTWEMPDGYGQHVAYSADGSTLAAVGYGLAVWQAEDGRLVHSSSRVFSPMLALSPTADAYAVSGWNAALYDLPNPRTGTPLWTGAEDQREDIREVAFSPDGTLLAGGGRNLGVWDLSDASNPWREFPSDTVVETVAFSPDGTQLAAGSHVLAVYDVDAGTELWRDHAESNVWSVAFSPDGALLVAGYDDGTLRIFDASLHQSVMTLTGHSGRVHSVAWHPEGGLLASASEDGTVRLWTASS